jgi:hypothetical protein
MLRHIISVSLAMTACATLMPIKATAATLTVTPRGEIPQNVGDLVQFTVTLNPSPSNSNSFILRALRFAYDRNELSLRYLLPIVKENDEVIDRTVPTNIAFFTFNVFNPVQEDSRDSYIERDFYVEVDYQEGGALGTAYGYGGNVVPVPEPLTIFGTATALGCGVLFKRKSSKKTVS